MDDAMAMQLDDRMDDAMYDRVDDRMDDAMDTMWCVTYRHAECCGRPWKPDLATILTKPWQTPKPHVYIARLPSGLYTRFSLYRVSYIVSLLYWNLVRQTAYILNS